MTWFPVITAEIASAERQLGVALPRRYKKLLSEPRVVRMLSHHAIGALSPEHTMQLFVDITRQFRNSVPNFPQDGVVATFPEGRYVRFWLPDSIEPGVLGEMLYSWDTHRHRKIRDCTSAQWVESMIDSLYGIDPAFVTGLGYPPPNVRPVRPRFDVRRCEERLLQLLALRGRQARTAMEAVGGWLPCARLMVRGRHLTPCDLGQLPRTTDWALRTSPGVFIAEVTLALSRLGEWPIISALRLRCDGVIAEESQQTSTIDVDAAAIAIYDRQSFQRKFRVDERDGVIDELIALQERPCIAGAGRSFELLVAPSGEGDGSYPVYELRSAGNPIGLEIRFL